MATTSKLIFAVLLTVCFMTPCCLKVIQVASFVYDDKRIPIWTSLQNVSEIPHSQWSFRYYPIFTPEVDGKGELRLTSTRIGKDFQTSFFIQLDNHKVMSLAFNKVKEIYGDLNINQMDIFAFPVTAVKLKIPELFQHVPKARFPPDLLCNEEFACFAFHLPQLRFRVSISSPDEKTAEEVEDILPKCHLFFELTITRMSAETPESSSSEKMDSIVNSIDLQRTLASRQEHLTRMPRSTEDLREVREMVSVLSKTVSEMSGNQERLQHLEDMAKNLTESQRSILSSLETMKKERINMVKKWCENLDVNNLNLTGVDCPFPDITESEKNLKVTAEDTEYMRKDITNLSSDLVALSEKTTISEKTTKALSQRMNQLESSMLKSVPALVANLTKLEDKLSSRIEQTRNDTAERFQHVETTLSHISKKLHSDWLSLHNSVAETRDYTAEEIGRTAAMLLQNLTVMNVSLSTRFVELENSTYSDVEDIKESLVKLTSEGSSLATRLQEVANAMDDKLKHVNILISDLSVNATRVETRLLDKLALTDKHCKFAFSRVDYIDGFAQHLQQNLSMFQSSAAESVALANLTFSDRIQQLTNQIFLEISKTHENVSQTVSYVETVLSNLSTKLQSDWLSLHNSVAETRHYTAEEISRFAAVLLQNLTAITEENESLSTRFVELEDSTYGKIENVRKSLAKLTMAGSSLASRVHKMANAMDDKLRHVNYLIADQSINATRVETELSEKLAQTNKHCTHALSKVDYIDGFAQRLQQNLSMFESSVALRAALANVTFSDRIQQLTDRIFQEISKTYLNISQTASLLATRMAASESHVSQLSTGMSDLKLSHNQTIEYFVKNLYDIREALLKRIRGTDSLVSELSRTSDKLKNLHTPSCPSGWLKFQTPNGIVKCFLVGTNGVRLVDYDGNRRFCADRNAGLIQIQSNQENSFLKDYLIRMQYSFLIIGGRKDERGVWVWETGSRVEYFNWAEGEPNNADRKENCIVMNGETINGRGAGGWFDIICAVERKGSSFHPGCQIIHNPYLTDN